LNQCYNFGVVYARKQRVHPQKYVGRVLYKMLFQTFLFIYVIYGAWENLKVKPFHSVVNLCQIMLSFLINTNYYFFMVLINYFLANVSVRLSYYIECYSMEIKPTSTRNATLNAELRLSEYLDVQLSSYAKIVNLSERYNGIYSCQFALIIGAIFYNIVAQVSLSVFE
jgi:hypothetical protein